MPVGEGAIRVTTGSDIDPAKAEGSALIARAVRWPSLGHLTGSLAGAVQAQGSRWRLWLPVAFGAGCGLYFALPSEPPVALVMAPALALGLGVGLAVHRHSRALAPLLLALFLVSGLAVAKLRSDAVAAPIAPALAEPTRITGWVIDVDSPGQRGGRLVLAPVRIAGLAPDEVPHRLRLTLRDGAPPPPGTALSVLAIVNPPPPPAAPGAYDFGRQAWFQGLGGTAFALTPVRNERLDPPPVSIRIRMAVNAVRFSLAERVVARMGLPEGGIAAAMVTGHEAWITPEDTQVMRDSGLAHILSISGLHMAIVGGFVFFTARLAIAAWPWLALRLSAKKLAALAGAGAVGLYLVISGAPPPAERAAIVAWTAFAAILLDRRAVSMNGLALAALIILLHRPESVIQPGFQMSFAATAALVALAEAWPRRIAELSVPPLVAAIQRGRDWLVAACAASLVAGLATGPFALQHFNRSAVYGLIANVVVAPVSSFLMMPGLALGAALEPLGLGAPFLWIAGRSVAFMLWVGQTVSDLPGAIRLVPSAPDLALPIAFLGILFICLWTGRGRWLGLPLAAAVLIWPRAEPADVWIGPEGTNAAIRSGSDAVAVRPEVRRFALDMWAQRRGLTVVEGTEAPCERYSCVLSIEGAPSLAHGWGRRPPDEARLSELCAGAEVVVLRAIVPRLPPACDGRLVLDGQDMARLGATELWRDGEGWRAVSSQSVRGARPWSQPPQ